jgi:hypothetical protein
MQVRAGLGRTGLDRKKNACRHLPDSAMDIQATARSWRASARPGETLSIGLAWDVGRTWKGESHGQRFCLPNQVWSCGQQDLSVPGCPASGLQCAMASQQRLRVH